MVGARICNVWSIAVDRERDDVHCFIAQPLIRYQFSKNCYFTSSPTISSDWNHPHGEGWTIPVGGGIGYALKFANQPMQISLEGYYNAVKPTVAREELLGDWTIRTQWEVLFPKGTLRSPVFPIGSTDGCDENTSSKATNPMAPRW